MDFSTIIHHMNTHHQLQMIALCKKFGGAEKVDHVTMKSLDFDGIDLVYNQQINLRIDFPQRANNYTIKQIIIDLCQSASLPDLLEIEKEIQAFKQSFASCILATISKDNFPLSSYAPLIQMGKKNYIYISAIAQHYENIKENPKKITIMFLEDECKAQSIILRKRLYYKAQATFIERQSQEFEEALNHLQNSMNNTGGIKTIRNFSDFHLILLDLKDGRFVKGFGQAYDISDNGEIFQTAATGNPHGHQLEK